MSSVQPKVQLAFLGDKKTRWAIGFFKTIPTGAYWMVSLDRQRVKEYQEKVDKLSESYDVSCYKTMRYLYDEGFLDAGDFSESFS